MLPDEPNPFRPGDMPLVLAGRTDIRQEIVDVVGALGHIWRPVILEGPRGVGKTSLIDWSDEPLKEAGVVHIRLEAQRDRALFDLFDQWCMLNRPILNDLGIAPRASSTSSVGVELAVGPAKLRHDRSRQKPETPVGLEMMVALVDAAAARKSAVMVSIDEAQLGGRALLADVASLLTTARNQRWPLNMIVAGLRSMRKLIDHKGHTPGSFGQLERASWFSVPPQLEEVDTIIAFAEPLGIAGVDIVAGEAASRAYHLTHGYPYAIQLLGSEVWNVARGEKIIARHHLDLAESAFEVKLRASLLDSRWDQLSHEERRYVTAMATLMKQKHSLSIRNAEIATFLSEPPSKTTYLRERLLDDGILVTLPTAPREARFVVPSMRDHILAHSDFDF